MTARGVTLFVKKGMYYISYTDDEGRRRQRSTHRRRKADALSVLSDFKSFLVQARAPKHFLFSSFIEEFLRFAKVNLSPQTVKVYKNVFRRFVRINGDLDLKRITPRHWDAYKTTRLQDKVSLKHPCKTPEETARALAAQRTMSPVSVHIELRTLRAAMETAVRWRMLEANPFHGLALVAIPRKLPVFLSIEDAVRLLNAVKEKYMRDFIIFALNTGMRRGEMLSLRWSDIDYEHRLARIANQDDFTVKAGVERVVSLNAAAMKVIERQVRSRYHHFIFSSKHGARLTADHATKLFKDAAILAGLPSGIHLHSTRHSFASWLVGQGTSLYAVSKLLGHSTTKTSEIYAHLLPQQLQPEVEKIKIGGN